MAENFPPPGWEDAMRRIREAIQSLPKTPFIPQETFAAARAGIEAIQQQLANVAIPALENWQFQFPRAEWLQIADQLRDAAARWQQEFSDALPTNWVGLDLDAVLEIVEHMRDAKLCLVWLPEPAILREILGAPPTRAYATLLAHRDDVLRQATDMLTHGKAPDFERERGAARDAIAAYRSGHLNAAQALAAATFTSTCHVLFNHGGTSKIARDMRTLDPMDAAVAQLRIQCIYMISAIALEKFNPVAAIPAFTHFNRHSSLHRITREQYNDEAALAAIVLATAFLREIDEWPDLWPTPPQV